MLTYMSPRPTTQAERPALRDIQERDDIIIKPADKGSAVVVMDKTSPRFLCRLTALIKLLVAVQRQRVLYTETIEFASPAIVSAHFHVSWLSDFIFYHKPYINRFTNHFSIHS